MAREGVPLIVIQRQLGHTSLGVTSIYLQGIDSTEIIDAVHARRAPMIPVDASLRLSAQLPVVVQPGSAGRAGRRSG
jgi:integrase/recombinase XerD